MSELSHMVEKVRTACKVEQIHIRTTIFTQNVKIVVML